MGFRYRWSAEPCYSPRKIGVNAAVPLADKRSRPCEAGKKKQAPGAPGACSVRRKPGLRRLPEPRRLSELIDEVELQGVYVLANDVLQAQLGVPIEEVTSADSPHEAVVVAEVQPGASDQVDLGGDPVARHAGCPQAFDVSVAADSEAERVTRFHRGILVPDFGVYPHLRRDLGESVAAEELVAHA